MSKENYALGHLYSLDREGKDRPDKNARLVILALLTLYKYKAINKIVLTTGAGLSLQAEKHLRKINPNIPQEDIIVVNDGLTTRAETRAFAKVVKDKGEILYFIYSGPHQERCERASQKTFGDQKVFSISAEKILRGSFPKPQMMEKALLSVENSPEYQSLIKHEKVISLVDRIPYLGDIFFVLSDFIPGKVAVQRKIIGMIEKSHRP